MIGTSYVGTLPIGAASLGVDGLKAIVPIAGVSSYYDHRRSYGTVINSFPTIGTDADTLFDNVLTRRYPEACAEMRERIARGKDRETGDYNAFWDERNYVKEAARFKTAVLISHGLNDFNVKPRHAARLWAALKTHKVPAKIWWHRGGHGDRAHRTRQAVWRDTLNRFWSHHLFGVENGAMDGPRAVIERENHAWIEYRDWPVPGAQATTVRWSPGTLANGIGRLAVQKPPPGVVEVIVDDASIDAAALVAAPQSPHRLLYQSPALAAPVHVSGIPSVYTIAFELQPHDYIFPAGSRIGFVLLSSDRLFTLRPPPGTQLTLHASESTLTLPVVGGEQAFVAASRPRVARVP
jgi:X-Pro dipeptidyl-peptidase